MLATREHSRKEMRGKLASRGYGEDEIEQVLDDLAQRGLQSEDRFVEHYIDSRVRKGNGPTRIRAELRERGISDGMVAGYLDNYAADWPDVIRRVHDSKYGSEPPGDRKDLARRVRFLEYRGFPSELIGQLLLNHDY